MKRKAVFLILFVPAYYLLMVVLLQFYWFNYNANVASVLSRLLHCVAFVLSVPVLIPFIFTDLGEYWPIWAQALPFLLNGLLWSVALLLVSAGIKHLGGKRNKPQEFPSQAAH